MSKLSNSHNERDFLLNIKDKNFPKIQKYTSSINNRIYNIPDSPLDKVINFILIDAKEGKILKILCQTKLNPKNSQQNQIADEQQNILKIFCLLYGVLEKRHTENKDKKAKDILDSYCLMFLKEMNLDFKLSKDIKLYQLDSGILKDEQLEKKFNKIINNNQAQKFIAKRMDDLSTCLDILKKETEKDSPKAIIKLIKRFVPIRQNEYIKISKEDNINDDESNNSQGCFSLISCCFRGNSK